MKSAGIKMIAVSALAALMLPAQASAQSVFGLNFLGEHRISAGARYTALSYSAIAVPDTNNALTMNPASLADLTQVTLSIYEALGMSRVSYGDINANQNRFQLPDMIIAVPLRKGLVLSSGYRTGFFGRGELTYDKDIGYTPMPHELYKLNSSLFDVPIAVSWRPAGWLSVSGQVQFDRGSIGDEIYVYFNDNDYRSISSKRTRSFSSTSWGASLLMQLHPRAWVGFSFNDRINYDVQEKIEYSSNDLDSTSSFGLTLPASFNAGAAFRMTGRWWLSSALWYRKRPDPAGYPQFEGSLGDESVLGFGIERRASREGRLISRLPLRFGYYEDRWHLEFPAGEPVIARFVTLGSGFPIPGGPGSLDFTLEFGQIGSKSDNIVDEKMFRFGLSMSMSEPWSKRKVEKH